MVSLFPSENVTDTAHFESALVNLVNYISSVATQARIIITGQFWTNQVKETACIQAAATTGATYVRIDQFDTAAYKERVGNSVFGDDYQWHQIDNAAVAEHPSDAGMQAIANAILDGLFSYAF